MRYALAVLFAIILACATVPYSGPIMQATVSSSYRDPVDVSFYCSGARIRQVRWLMQGRTEVVKLRVGPSCDLRVIIQPSITGSKYTAPEPFDSRQHLYHARGCRKLDVRAGTPLPASFTLPSEC